MGMHRHADKQRRQKCENIRLQKGDKQFKQT
jgi:hypothetical protein